MKIVVVGVSIFHKKITTINKPKFKILETTMKTHMPSTLYRQHPLTIKLEGGVLQLHNNAKEKRTGGKSVTNWWFDFA